MILILLIVGTYLYVKIAIYITKKIPPSKSIIKSIIVSSFILLPFIDVIIGYAAYFSICLFDCKTVVYKKIKGPVSVYIEEYNEIYNVCDCGIAEFNQKSYLFNDISFVEMNVKEKCANSVIKFHGLNRFEINSFGKLTSTNINNIKSRLKYKYIVKKIRFVPVTVRKAVLSDIETGEIYTKDTSATIKYLGIGFVPYFNWLKWHDQIVYSLSCNDNIYRFKHLILSTVTD